MEKNNIAQIKIKLFKNVMTYQILYTFYFFEFKFAQNSRKNMKLNKPPNKRIF